MPNANEVHRNMALSRRTFLRRAAIAATALAGPAALANNLERRTLTFIHTHTGERLVAPYFQGGCYQTACLSRINYLLRDFRTTEVHVIDPSLLDILFDLQVLADRDAVFEVISGYRSPTTNRQLRRQSSGVAEHSLHIQGKAIDIRLSGFPTAKLRDCARSLQRGGVGYYAASDFVHVDTGRVRFW